VANLAACIGIQEAVHGESGAPARQTHLLRRLAGEGDVHGEVLPSIGLQHLGVEALDDPGGEGFPGSRIPMRHCNPVLPGELVQDMGFLPRVSWTPSEAVKLSRYPVTSCSLVTLRNVPARSLTVSRFLASSLRIATVE